MTLRILLHNVGHGQAVHAFTPGGHVVVIDLGCSDAFSPLEWLRGHTATIDNLVITHPHGDHIDEILNLAAHGFLVRQLWHPKWLPADVVRAANQVTYAAKVNRYLEMSGVFSHPIPAGELVGNPAVTGGVSITKYAASACGPSNINNHSGVVVFDYLGIKVVIPGDNEPPSWRELLKNPQFVSSAKGADVFMASHHGRESGYCADLFHDIQGIKKPRLCAISDGRVQDTDATTRYSYHARGWPVHSCSGHPSGERCCVTTRSDGYVEIKIGRGSSDGKTFLSVTTP